MSNRTPVTSSPLCPLLLAVLIFLIGGTAAEALGGVTGPQPCAPAAPAASVASWYFYGSEWPAFDPLEAPFACDWWMLALTVPPVSATELGLLLCGIATLAIIYKHLRGFRDGVVMDIKRELRGDGAADAAQRLPQPLIVTAEKIFAREEELRKLHEQIIPRQSLEKELGRLETDQQKIALRVETVAGMVTEMKEDVLTAGDERLKVMTLRLDKLDRHAATHEERSKNVQHAMDSMETKIDSLLRDRGLPATRKS